MQFSRSRDFFHYLLFKKRQESLLKVVSGWTFKYLFKYDMTDESAWPVISCDHPDTMAPPDGTIYAFKKNKKQNIA